MNYSIFSIAELHPLSDIRNVIRFIIKKNVSNPTASGSPSTERVPLIERLRREISEASLACSSSTTTNRNTAVNALERFFSEKLGGGSRITAGTLTEDHIRGFELWHAEKHLTANYCACNMSNLRSLLNRMGEEAGGRERIRQLFRNVRTRRTAAQSKKAESRDNIRSLVGLETAEGSPMDLSRDVFLLCMMLQGMPPIDLVFLKKKQLRDGRIVYNRHKTQCIARPKVTPEAMRIIEKYSHNGSDYLLPIITSDDPRTAERQYRNFLQRHNRCLREMAGRIGNGCRLTSYTPRHTWASTAHMLGISDNEISQALAHTNTATTQEYLSSICDEKLDRNSIIVSDFLLGKQQSIPKVTNQPPFTPPFR